MGIYIYNFYTECSYLVPSCLWTTLENGRHTFCCMVCRFSLTFVFKMFLIVGLELVCIFCVSWGQINVKLVRCKVIC